MSEPEIVILPDNAAVAEAAAARLAAGIAAAVGTRGRALVALSGGGTPLAMFRLLAQPPYRTAVPWADTHIFWADERLVPPDDPGSNYYHAADLLLRHVPLPPANVHRLRGEWPATVAAEDYAARLAAFAEDGTEIPRLDMVLLGLGSDGHTASLFPGSPVEATLPVVAAHADYEGRPAERLSLTPLVFNAARTVLFLVTGANKSEAVAATLRDEDDPQRWPAQRIQPDGGAVVWLLDNAAAAGLAS